MPPPSLRMPRLVRAAIVGLVAGMIVVAWMASERCGVDRDAGASRRPPGAAYTSFFPPASP